MIALIPLITEALRLANTILVGIPLDQRQAQARVWWLTWWPITKSWLRLAGISDEEIRQVEEMTKK